MWILVPILIVLLIALLLAVRLMERKRLQALDMSARQQNIVPIKVITVQADDILRSVRCSGVLQAWQKAVILAEVSGKVISINARVGDQLEPGSPILKIDDEMPTYAVEQAEAKMLQLESNYEISKRELERKKTLYKNKVISEFEFEIARAKVKADQAVLKAAQASLKLARRELRETLITSPIQGILADRSVDVGSNIIKGINVATVVDINRVKIKAGVSDKEVAEIQLGQRVEVETDAYPRQIFIGSVYSVGTKADDSTLSFPVEIVLENQQASLLKPGMVARATIQTGMYVNAVALPQEAMLGPDGQHFTWTVNSSKAYKAAINPIDLIGSDIIIQTGLDPGQQIVISGQDNLFEGCQVHIIGK